MSRKIEGVDSSSLISPEDQNISDGPLLLGDHKSDVDEDGHEIAPEGVTVNEDGSLNIPDDYPVVCSCCSFDFYPWLMLMFIMFLTFGSYWVFDTPGAIYDQLKKYMGHGYSKSKNLNLYAIYSWPNTVLAFFGGYIVDKITGVRLGALLFCGLILTGQLIFALGIESKSYWVCFAGRFVFGLGGESLTVAQNTFTVRWFEGKLRALAFGIVVAFSRVGSSVNFVVTPSLAKTSVPFAVWFGTGMTLLSFVACICAMITDKAGEPRVRDLQARERVELAKNKRIMMKRKRLTKLRERRKRALELKDRSQGNYAALDEDQDAIEVDMSDDGSLDKHGRSKSYYYRAPITNVEELDAALDCMSDDEADLVPPAEVSLSQVRHFPFPSWVLFFITLFFYIGVLTFYTVASDIMQHTGKKYSEDTATFFLSIPNFVSIFASPMFGRIIDRNGKALYWIMTACVINTTAHVAFMILAYEWVLFPPPVIMVVLGVGYAMGAASLWPSLALIIPQRYLGTAYGCMTSIQNVGLAVFPQMIGILQGADGIDGTKLEYTLPIFIFIGCTVLAFFLTLILYRYDVATFGGRINASAAERVELLGGKALSADEMIESLMVGVDDGESVDLYGKSAQYRDPNSIIVSANDFGRSGDDSSVNTRSTRVGSMDVDSSDVKANAGLDSGALRNALTAAGLTDRDDEEEVRLRETLDEIANTPPTSLRSRSGSLGASYERRSMMGQ